MSRVSLKLRRNSAAATRTISASAASTPISTFRIALRPAVRDPLRSAVCGSSIAQLHRRRDAEHQTADDAERHREPEADRIEVRLKLDRKCAENRYRTQGIGGPRRDDGSEARADDPEHDVFGEQQRRHAGRAGAERQANAHFAAACAGAREQQVRGVAANRQQQEQQDALQHHQRVREHPLRSTRRLPERQHLALQLRVRFWIRTRQLAHRLLELGLCLRAGDAGTEATKRRVAAEIAIFELARSRQQRRRHRRRHPHVEIQAEDRALKTLRRDADHRQRYAIDTNGLPNGCGTGAETAPPEIVRDHDDGFARLARVASSARMKRPSDRPQAERREVVARHEQAEGALRAARFRRR